MKQDFNLVTEKGVAPVSSNHLSINVLNEAQLAVFGEHSGGYIFDAPTAIATSGILHIAYWSKGELLAEEPLNCGSKVDIIHGVAKLYVCDFKHFVIVYDNESKFTIGLLEGGGKSGSAKSAAGVLDRAKAATK